MDERRDVSGVPQLWTLRGPRHVHWAEHTHTAGTYTTNAYSDAVTDALAESFADGALGSTRGQSSKRRRKPLRPF